MFLNITKTQDFELRKLHNIKNTTKIFFMYYFENIKKGGIFSSDKKFHYSMLFLEKGITFLSKQLESGWLDVEDQDIDTFIQWNEIESAEATKDEYNFNVANLFIKNSTDKIEIQFGHINDDTFFGLDENDNQLIARLIDNISNNYTDVLSNSVDEIIEFIKKEQFDNALQKISETIKISGEKSFDSALLYYFQARCFLETNELEKANQSMKYCTEIKTQHELDLDSDEFSLLALIHKEQGKDYDSIRLIKKAYNKAEKNEEKEEYSGILKDLTNNLKSSFLSIPTEKRKYIVISKSFKEYPDKNLIGLQKDCLPDIKINGIMSENEVFVLHPLLNNIYLSLENFESQILVEKFSEFQYIMQCLGAKEINIEWRKGKKAEEMYISNNEIGGGASYKGFGASGNYIEQNSKENTSSSKHKIAMKQVFEQTNQMPYIPDNLIWYNNEPRWQQLFQQRLNGSILKDSILISNENISKGSSSELQELQASLDISIFIANANLKEEYKSKFRKEEKTEWCINVDFYPTSKQNIQSVNVQVQKTMSSLNENEQKYIDEIKFLFEDDGVIDEDEKKILFRKQQKYGISDIRAKELENQITDKSKLNENETEYKDEYLENLKENGEITDNIRRVLERLRLKLNISEERAKEIENLVKFDNTGQYSEQELKYIEELKFCLEDDDEITSSERRMLNKERDKLGITEQRADIIEKEFIKTIKR